MVCWLQNYFRDRWNVFDFITVIGSITDVLVTSSQVNSLLLFPLSCTTLSTQTKPIWVLGHLVPQSGLSSTLPSRAIGQNAAAGLHHPHPPVDLHPVLQGSPLRLPSNRNALLHLRHCWHAGGWRHHSVVVKSSLDPLGCQFNCKMITRVPF